MLLPALIVVTIILNVLLALFVLKKNHKNDINLSFVTFIISIVLWIVFNYFSNTVTDPQLAFLFNKLIFVVGPYIVLSLLYFALVFPKYTYKTDINNVLIALLIPVVIVNILTFFDYVISGVSFLDDGGTGVDFAPGIMVFVMQFVSYLIVAIGLLAKKFIKARGYERLQLQYLLIGIAITMVIGTVTNLILPTMFNNFAFGSYGPLSTIAVVAFTAYAIVKHRLLEIRALLVRSVIYTALILVIGGIYTFSLYILGRLVLLEYASEVAPYVSLILVLFIVFSFQPLKNFIERITNSIFYRDKYDPNELLSKLGKISTSTLNLKQLVDDLVRELFIQMKISSVTLGVTKETGDFYHIKSIGENEQKMLAIESHKINDLIVHAIEKSEGNILVFDDIQHESLIKKIMREYDVRLLVPLVVKDETVGILLLGDKSSGEMYSPEDIDMFRILADSIAVAINNSLSYEEIVHFNETLEQKVNKATQNLQHANERLKELDRVKDEFVSIASHEMRTPLTVIRSYLWMILQGKSGKVGPKQKMYLERAFTSADRLIDLVNDMLNVARIEAGRMSLIKVRNDVSQALRNVITGMGLRAQELSIDLKYIQKKRTLPKAEVDAEKIEQVVINLVGNSLKFTPAGGTITVSSDYDRDEAEIVVCVADTGIGISKEDLPKLFHKFSNPGGDYKTRTNMQSTGLGLYLSKQIVKMHGGRMWAESDGEGKGARLYFSIPVK